MLSVMVGWFGVLIFNFLIFSVTPEVEAVTSPTIAKNWKQKGLAITPFSSFVLLIINFLYFVYIRNYALLGWNCLLGCV